MKSRRADLPPAGNDPVMSIDWCCDDLGISRPTWYRSVRPHIEITAVTDRLRGVRLSVHEAYKASRTRRPGRAA